MATRGVFPGSFDPLTVAHVAIAEAAHERFGLTTVDLVLSRVALGKDAASQPRVEDRAHVVHQVARRLPWIGAGVTDQQLLADVARGYDVLVVGADKWHQLRDPAFYGGDAARRDEALARLPRLAVAPRPPWELPDRAELAAVGVDGEPLDLGDHLAEISSSAVRGGAHDLMAPEARAFDRASGAWSDPDRYRRWVAAGGRA